jgi:hypothetical protein
MSIVQNEYLAGSFMMITPSPLSKNSSKGQKANSITWAVG